VSFGFHPEEVRAAGPEYVVDSYAELVALVERRTGAARVA
jgi:hypothetical protein